MGGSIAVAELQHAMAQARDARGLEGGTLQVDDALLFPGEVDRQRIAHGQFLGGLHAMHDVEAIVVGAGQAHAATTAGRVDVFNRGRAGQFRRRLQFGGRSREHADRDKARRALFDDVDVGIGAGAAHEQAVASSAIFDHAEIDEKRRHLVEVRRAENAINDILNLQHVASSRALTLTFPIL